MESRPGSVATSVRIALSTLALSAIPPIENVAKAQAAAGAGSAAAGGAAAAGLAAAGGTATSAAASAGGMARSGRGGYYRPGYGRGGFPILVGPSPVFFMPMPYPYAEPPFPTRTPANVGGLMLPSPAGMPFAPAPAPAARPVAARRPDPNRAGELLTMGDRLFRAANYKKAEERYVQSAKADPNSASPYLRLAQLALVRGQFAKAADFLRTAQVVEPGWLVNVPDIQGLYAEPADFAKVIAKLETQVQAHPEDRDAWFALGAELFLSGRVARSRDVFSRLADRKVDDALAAFLDAATPPAPGPSAKP